MAVMTSDATAVPRPSAEPILLSVDEVTILLGLLGVLAEEHDGDDVAAVAGRTAQRLRELLGAATA
jgi:hypothetical protein